MTNISEIHSAGTQYYKTSRAEMMCFIPSKRGRILEIGCGEGVFSASIEGARETWGVEPTNAAKIAAARLHKVIQKTFEDAEPELPKNYFDLVICNDVIEHLPDHDKFFEDIRNYIAPGGVLIGSIPNVRYYVNLFDILVGRDWEYRDAGIMDRTHLRFFTERSLRRTFERHKFHIELFKGVNSGIRWNDSSILGRHKLFGIFAVIGSLGYFSDIRHLQYGFRIAPDER